MRSDYLLGIDLKTPKGEEVDDATLQRFIDNATSMLEHYLDISITPFIGQIEDKDYRYSEYFEWGFFQLNNFPVIKINSLKLSYFRDANGDAEIVQEIPLNWIRIENHSGIVRLIPNARFPANLQIGATGAYFPEILKSSFVPDLWIFDYDHGFQDGCIPVIINEAIARLAAIQVLILAGNFVLGAGIASQSLSLDGLSQSVSTTQSAENSVFSANLLDHQRILFGRNKGDPSLMATLKDYYKGSSMAVI